MKSALKAERLLGVFHRGDERGIRSIPEGRSEGIAGRNNHSMGMDAMERVRVGGRQERPVLA